MTAFGRWFGVALLALALRQGAGTPLAAQGVTGAAVEGVITQEGGAAVEGAQVELFNAQTGQTYRTTTSARGRFYLDNVLPAAATG
jgi:hypothetical protein